MRKKRGKKRQQLSTLVRHVSISNGERELLLLGAKDEKGKTFFRRRRQQPEKWSKLVSMLFVAMDEMTPALTLA